jgi:hypothetical protein
MVVVVMEVAVWWLRWWWCGLVARGKEEATVAAKVEFGQCWADTMTFLFF